MDDFKELMKTEDESLEEKRLQEIQKRELAIEQNLRNDALNAIKKSFDVFNCRREIREIIENELTHRMAEDKDFTSIHLLKWLEIVSNSETSITNNMIKFMGELIKNDKLKEENQGSGTSLTKEEVEDAERVLKTVHSMLKKNKKDDGDAGVQ